ncbi:MAG: cytochrome c family protein [Planctomycetota bacterium]|jgi:hypothetical protein
MSGKAPLVVLVLVACSVAVALAVGSRAVPPAVGQEAAKYVGTGKCRTCHKDEHKAWLEMKHSKAWESLTPEQRVGGKDEKGRACVECHVTGFGKEGGFVSEEKTPKLTNVGCESCHGPGSLHFQLMFENIGEDTLPEDKKIGKSVGCTDCHNPHISYKKKYGKKE